MACRLGQQYVRRSGRGRQRLNETLLRTPQPQQHGSRAVSTICRRQRPWPCSELTKGAHGKRTDDEFPSKDNLQVRSEQAVEEEVRAESLNQVTSVADTGEEPADTGLMFSVGIPKVTLRTASGRVRVPAPTNTEQLRHRYRLVQIQLEIVSKRHAERAWFQNYDPNVWNTVLNRLLGPQIPGHEAHGGTRLRWEDYLAFEHKIWSKAAEGTNEGEGSFTVLWLRALRDAELKATHFILPLTVSRKRSSSRPAREEVSASKRLPQETRDLTRKVNQIEGGKGKAEKKAKDRRHGLEMRQQAAPRREMKSCWKGSMPSSVAKLSSSKKVDRRAFRCVSFGSEVAARGERLANLRTSATFATRPATQCWTEIARRLRA